MGDVFCIPNSQGRDGKTFIELLSKVEDHSRSSSTSSSSSSSSRGNRRSSSNYGYSSSSSSSDVSNRFGRSRHSNRRNRSVSRPKKTHKSLNQGQQNAGIN